MGKLLAYLFIAFIIGSVLYVIYKYGFSIGTIIPLILTIVMSIGIINMIVNNIRDES